MRFGILGPLDVRRDDGTPVELTGPRGRTLLATLALDAGKVVPASRLIDVLYGATPPAGAANALQAQVSRLRTALGGHIAHTPAGYRLDTDPGDVDALRFERLTAERRFAEALALWRGPALDGLPETLRGAAARLTELHLTAYLGLVDTEPASPALLTGTGSVPGLPEMISRHPLHEGLRARHIRLLAAVGRPAEALAAYEEARLLLDEELGTIPSAELTAAHLSVLRGDDPPAAPGPAARPVRAAPGRDASGRSTAEEPRPSPPGAASRDTTPERVGVPVQFTALVGREAELAAIRETMSAARLVTLTGPGGTGKTRLAAEACAHAPGPVYFVELAPLADAAELPQAVLSTLGLREGRLLKQGAQPVADPVDRIVAGIGDRPMLIVLDNCEHLVEAAAGFAGRLLAACPGLRIMATSREPLAIAAERLCPIPPLALPPSGVDPADALSYPSVRLFAERAAAVRPGFWESADPGELDAVIRICRALDGLPLAIELAAARVRTLPVTDIADATDPFAVLARGSRTAEPRHRTLRAVIAWSWDLLDDDERTLARRLTVFRGGATLKAAQEVCGLPRHDVLDLLAGLTDKSLIEVAGTHYRMLDTIRAFCAEQLAEAGEEERFRQAHAAWFRDFALAADPHLRTGDQLEWLRRMDADHENMLAALRHAPPADALLLYSGLTGYWWLRGLRSESIASALELLARLGPRPEMSEEFAVCVLSAVVGGVADPVLRAHLDRVGDWLDGFRAPHRQPLLWVLWSQAVGPPDPAAADDLIAVQATFELDPWTRSLSRFGWGLLALFEGDHMRAEENLLPALAGFTTIGDRWGMSMTTTGLAEIAEWTGRRAEALDLIERSLDLLQTLGTTVDIAELLCRRAQNRLVLSERSDPAQYAAIHADFTRAADLAREAGAVEMIGRARIGLADLARLHGSLDEARELAEQVLAECGGDWFSLDEIRVAANLTLGWISYAEGDPDRTEHHHRQALSSVYVQRNRLQAARVTAGLAGAVFLRDDPAGAAALLGISTALREGLPSDEPDPIRLAARCRAVLGEATYAAAHARGLAMPKDRLIPVVLELAPPG
ncbi:BTAD domain-containing putative transcriptional regulator [Herbidospora sp. NBRC 101105]|uniref:AfsR/SARP family transcriptional regulator n=1 Tax=Herbidospora sp. NBRC 101105 TaxID=3032195 RepID=UPI0024A2A007|nr:BTAD domain-containing putative transcriptional regulator [Herbidospora sp. NBRC 101105]GLX92179.1 SARP family transcriptional regulator [Herbidospora sp. NBRC 101105]